MKKSNKENQHGSVKTLIKDFSKDKESWGVYASASVFKQLMKKVAGIKSSSDLEKFIKNLSKPSPIALDTYEALHDYLAAKAAGMP